MLLSQELFGRSCLFPIALDLLSNQSAKKKRKRERENKRMIRGHSFPTRARVFLSVESAAFSCDFVCHFFLAKNGFKFELALARALSIR